MLIIKADILKLSASVIFLKKHISITIGVPDNFGTCNLMFFMKWKPKIYWNIFDSEKKEQQRVKLSFLIRQTSFTWIFSIFSFPY